MAGVTRFHTIEAELLALELRTGEAQRRFDAPAWARDSAWAGVILRIADDPAPLDVGLVGELVEVSAQAWPVDEETRAAFGDGRSFEVNLPRSRYVRARWYRLPVAQGRPPIVFVELVVSRHAVTERAQPHRHRGIGFVPLAGHGFSLTAPTPFEAYIARVKDGDAMRRFTTTDEGEALLHTGHFVPVWGIHQWDYRLVVTRQPLSTCERVLLGPEVVPPRSYPLDLGSSGRLDVLPDVPQLTHVSDGLTRVPLALWPGRYRATLSAFSTDSYGAGLVPTYLLELGEPTFAPPDEPMNGLSPLG